ncbi:MAG: exosortase [Deltaproteobacteria bacterium]|nr:exosortase [Deltaproteobacteria bacterium]
MKMADHKNCRGHRTAHWARTLATALLAIGLVGAPTAALAEPEYDAARKVGRGFANVALGFLAIPGQMIIESKRRGPGAGLPLGFAMGIGWFVTTEVVGVWEILSCPFEIPAGFRPMIDPEFPWDYFDAIDSAPSDGAALKGT